MKSVLKKCETKRITILLNEDALVFDTDKKNFVIEKEILRF